MVVTISHLFKLHSSLLECLTHLHMYYHPSLSVHTVSKQKSSRNHLTGRNIFTKMFSHLHAHFQTVKNQSPSNERQTGLDMRMSDIASSRVGFATSRSATMCATEETTLFNILSVSIRFRSQK